MLRNMVLQCLGLQSHSSCPPSRRTVTRQDAACKVGTAKNSKSNFKTLNLKGFGVKSPTFSHKISVFFFTLFCISDWNKHVSQNIWIVILCQSPTCHCARLVFYKYKKINLVMLGTIQVFTSSWFWTFLTHPPTLSSDVSISYTHLKHDVIISSYPPTYL